MGIRNLQDALEKYGKDDFKQYFPYSYILMTKTQSMKSSPSYKTLNATVRNKNFDEEIDARRKADLYKKTAKNMGNDLGNQEYPLIQKLIEIEIDKKQTITMEDFKTLWSYIRNHRPEAQLKYQEAMRLIGKKADGLPMDFVIEETTFSHEKDDDEEENN